MRKSFPIADSLLWSVLFLPMIPMVVMGMDTDDYLSHLLATLGVMLCWGVMSLLAHGRYRSILLSVIVALSAIPYLLNVGWFLMSGEILHNNQYWAIFDTNLSEIKGFIQMIPICGFVLLGFVLIVLIVLLVWSWRESWNDGFSMGRGRKILCILLLIFPFLVPQMRRCGFPLNFYSSMRGYIDDLSRMHAFMAHRPNLEGKVFYEGDDSVQTVVVVIGESFNRNRSNLYGYERITNPRLTQMADSLTIFQHVSSPDFLTQFCLTNMLTFPDTLPVTSTTVSPTLIEVLKQAGYRTYWFDNQGSRGSSDTFIPTSYRMLAAQADYFFVNPNNLQDETLLPLLDSVLVDSVANRKVIFLHLMGNHFPYTDRVPKDYPKTFTREDSCPSPFVRTMEQMDVYNAYDNALVYHDEVVYRLFHQAMTHSEVSAVLYLSDHGEEVYDEFAFAGRSHKYKSHNLYDIPCFLYKREKKNLDTQRAYNSGWLAFTVLQLCGVATEYDRQPYGLLIENMTRE